MNLGMIEINWIYSAADLGVHPLKFIRETSTLTPILFQRNEMSYNGDCYVQIKKREAYVNLLKAHSDTDK